MFPDRSVLELMSPVSFLEGVREVGLDDLQEFEAACLMRVLAKQELDNGIILNELIMIMENFGVLDQGPEDEEDSDDYIPDTEPETSEIGDTPYEDKPADATDKKDKRKKAKTYNLKNIDAKGIKILQKLARFLLLNYLHPREFFGAAIKK